LKCYWPAARSKRPTSGPKNSLRLLVGSLVGCLVAAAVFFVPD
jgi:hypothetical protein